MNMQNSCNIYVGITWIFGRFVEWLCFAQMSICQWYLESRWNRAPAAAKLPWVLCLTCQLTILHGSNKKNHCRHFFLWTVGSSWGSSHFFFQLFQLFRHCAGPSRKIEIREEAEPWWGKHLADLFGGLRELLIAQSLAWKEKRRRPVDLSFQRLEGLKDVEMMGKAESWKIIDAKMYQPGWWWLPKSIKQLDHMAVELKMKETSSSWWGGWEWGIFGITIGSVGIGTRSTGCPALFKDFQFIPNLPEVEVVLKEHVQFAKFRCTWDNRPTKSAICRLNHSCWAIPPYRPDTFYFDI